MYNDQLELVRLKLKDVYFNDETSVKWMYDTFWLFSKRFIDTDNMEKPFKVNDNRYNIEEYHKLCVEKLKFGKGLVPFFEE